MNSVRDSPEWPDVTLPSLSDIEEHCCGRRGGVGEVAQIWFHKVAGLVEGVKPCKLIIYGEVTTYAYHSPAAGIRRTEEIELKR